MYGVINHLFQRHYRGEEVEEAVACEAEAGFGVYTEGGHISGAHRRADLEWDFGMVY